MNLSKKIGAPVARRIVNALAVPIILFYALSLTGCVSSSPGLHDIYLVRLQHKGSSAAIRVGYNGVCMANTNTTYNCQSTTGKSAADIATLFEANAQVARLLGTAANIQSTIFLNGLQAAAGVIFLFGYAVFAVASFLMESGRARVRTNALLRHLTLGVLALATILELGVALGESQTAAAMEYAVRLNGGDFQFFKGLTVQGLLWATAVVQMGMLAGAMITFEGYRYEWDSVAPLPGNTDDVRSVKTSSIYSM